MDVALRMGADRSLPAPPNKSEKLLDEEDGFEGTEFFGAGFDEVEPRSPKKSKVALLELAGGVGSRRFIFEDGCLLLFASLCGAPKSESPDINESSFFEAVAEGTDEEDNPNKSIDEESEDADLVTDPGLLVPVLVLAS